MSDIDSRAAPSRVVFVVPGAARKALARTYRGRHDVHNLRPPASVAKPVCVCNAVDNRGMCFVSVGLKARKLDTWTMDGGA